MTEIPEQQAPGRVFSAGLSENRIDRQGNHHYNKLYG